MRDAHIRWLAAAVMALALVPPARADWPHWRGDGGNGVVAHGPAAGRVRA